jgi:glycosyltransferase involved in cell wall biosynthesis
MRILYIVHQFLPEFATGTERVTINIARTQQRNGHSVDVLTCSMQGLSHWLREERGLRLAVVDGMRVFALPRELFGSDAELGVGDNKRAVSIISKFLDRNTYDVVHVMHPMRMLDAIEIVKSRSIPYIITATDFYALCWRINLKRLDASFCDGPEGGRACYNRCVDGVATRERLAFRLHRLSTIMCNAKEIVACSDFVAEVFRREFPELAIRVIGHGIELPLYRPKMPRDTAAPMVLGYVGTISETKGIQILMEAFRRAAIENARLEIIGSSYGDDEFLARIQGLCTPGIGIRDEVAHRDIPQALMSFDVLCLPSLVPETFSLALHEGFAAGLPALVSDIGWPARAVETAACGKAIPAGNVEAWSEAIREVDANRDILGRWRNNIPLQARIEEEAFFYDQLYRRASGRVAWAASVASDMS